MQQAAKEYTSVFAILANMQDPLDRSQSASSISIGIVVCCVINYLIKFHSLVPCGSPGSDPSIHRYLVEVQALTLQFTSTLWKSRL
jgi:hypothetical protein